MKMCKDYWYNYSDTNLSASPNRLAVIKPTGNFSFNGQLLPRTASQAEIEVFLQQPPSLTASKPLLLQQNEEMSTKSKGNDKKKSLRLQPQYRQQQQQQLPSQPLSPPRRLSPSKPSLNRAFTGLSALSQTSGRSLSTGVAAHQEGQEGGIRPYSPDRYYNRLSTPKDEKILDSQHFQRQDQITKFKHLFHDDNFVTHPIGMSRLTSILLPEKYKVDMLEHMMNEKVILEGDDKDRERKIYQRNHGKEKKEKKKEELKQLIQHEVEMKDRLKRTNSKLQLQNIKR